MTRDFCNYLYCFYFLDLHNNPPFVLSCEIGLCKVVVEIGMDLTQALEFFLNLTWAVSSLQGSPNGWSMTKNLRLIEVLSAQAHWASAHAIFVSLFSVPSWFFHAFLGRSAINIAASWKDPYIFPILLDSTSLKSNLKVPCLRYDILGRVELIRRYKWKQASSLVLAA